MSGRVERIEIAVMSALLEADDLDDMAVRAVAALGKSLGWDAAFMWNVEEAKPRLVASWPGTGAREPEASSGQLRWTEHVLSVPIPIDDHVGWLVELHATAPRQPEPELVEVVGRLARVVGKALHRARWRSRLDAELDLDRLKLQRLHTSDVIAMMVTTADGRILEANDALLQMVGYSRDELSRGELRWDAITPPGWQESDARILQELAGGAVIHAYHKEYIRRDGSLVPVIVGAAPLGGEPCQHIAFVIDITAQKQVERQLEALNAELEDRVARRSEELRALARQLQNVREEQLAELSREIHDVFGQDVAVLKVDLGWLQRRFADGTTDVAALSARTAAMSERLDGLHSTIRRIASQLRPRILDDLGLVAAIESHARDLARRMGLAIELSLPDEISVPRELATALFRIYQELMTNVLRHASASRVEVSMTATDSEIVLDFFDDGVGIAPGARGEASLGLAGIRERALAFGGVFQIGPAAGGGTAATIRLPRQDSAS